MKIRFFILVVFTCICVNYPAFATEIEIDVQSKWNLSPTNEVTIELAIPLNGEDRLAGRAELIHLMDGSIPDVKLVLQARYSQVEKVLYGGYILPVSKVVDLEIGMNWREKLGEPEQNIFITGDWQILHGNLSAGSILSTADDKLYIRYNYFLYKPLIEHLLLEGSLGIGYTQSFSASADGVSSIGMMTIPLTLAGVYRLNEICKAIFVVENEFCLPEKQNNLRLCICLRTDFGKIDEKPKEQSFADNPATHLAFKPIPVVPNIETNNIVPETSLEEIPVITVNPDINVSSESGCMTTVNSLVPITQENDSILPEESIKRAKTQERMDQNYYDDKAGILYFQGRQYKLHSRHEQGQIFLPLREVAEMLGGEVYWKDSDRQICIVLPERRIFLDLLSRLYMCNGKKFFLSEEMRLIEGHYYVECGDLIKMMIRA